MFQWVFILIKISTWMWSLRTSLFISFHEWDLPLQCCEPLVGVQCRWPALPPQHGISHATSPRVYSHPGGRSLPVSSMDVSPCNCPLGVGLLPRLSLLLSGWLPRFMFCAEMGIRCIYQALFPDFHAHLSHAPRSPHQMCRETSAPRSPLTAPGFSSAGFLLNLLLMGPFLPSPSPSFSHHPFPPWSLQRPPFWPPVSCLPLSLPSAGRVSFLKNVCWKHVSGFPRLGTWSGSWMWSAEPHLLQLPWCSTSPLSAAHLPLFTRLLYKQYHSPLLPLQASLLLCLPLTPNIQVFLSFSLTLT